MGNEIQWDRIGLPGNPVPGDPARVRMYAKELEDKRSSVDLMAKVLGNIQASGGSSIFVGEAAKRFAARLNQFPTDMRKFSTGLNQAQKALSAWAACMEAQQDKAKSAFYKASSARNELHAARSKLNNASSQASAAKQDMLTLRDQQATGAVIKKSDEVRARDRISQAERLVSSFHRQLENAQGSYDAAMKSIDNAKDAYTDGARVTANKLQGALNETPSLSAWERVYYSDAWRVVVKIAEVGGIVFGVAALFCGGGGIIGLLAFACSAVGFVNDLMAYGEGDISWKELMLSGFSLGLTFLGSSGVLKESAKSLELLKDAKGMSKMSILRALGDPLDKGGYGVSNFSKLLGKSNGFIPTSKWMKEAGEFAKTSSLKSGKSLRMQWCKGFAKSVLGSARAGGARVMTSVRSSLSEMLSTVWHRHG